MATKLTHKQMTAHVRTRIRRGVESTASVNMYTSCGFQWVRVSSRYDRGEHFTADEQRLIQRIMHVNGFTYAQGLPIDENDPMGDEGHFIFDGQELSK